MALVPEWSPTELRRRWTAEAPHDVVVLDVREPEELEAAKLPEALHIPMRDVPARLADLPKDRTIVVMCHAGGRSARVAEYLLANGFEHVFNLRGGIDAWSVEVDPTIPRY
jgi:rhodanese-related sulfurtransferase